ncbi:MAG: hypothetical protein ABW061_17915 [Polyangiaceae bacterium]
MVSPETERANEPFADRLTIQSIALEASADPRSVKRELVESGSVRGFAGDRIRRVIALRSLSSMLPESARAELRAGLPEVRALARDCSLAFINAPDDPAQLPRVMPYDAEQAARFRTLHAQVHWHQQSLQRHVGAMPELQALLDQANEIKAILERALARVERSERTHAKRTKKRPKT